MFGSSPWGNVSISTALGLSPDHAALNLSEHLEDSFDAGSCISSSTPLAKHGAGPPGYLARTPPAAPPPPPPPALAVALGLRTEGPLGAANLDAAPSPSHKALLSLEVALHAGPPPGNLGGPPGNFRPAARVLDLSTAPDPGNAFESLIGFGKSFGQQDSAVSTFSSPGASHLTLSSDVGSDLELTRAAGELAAVPLAAVASPKGPPPGLALPAAPPLPPHLPSVGSTMHHAGGCRPCAWFWKDVGCTNAQMCSYCHICDEGALKAKKKNKQIVKRHGYSEGSPDGAQAKLSLRLSSLL